MTTLGVEGLEVGDGELRLGGVPFHQASLGQTIDAACALAFRRRPGARIAIIDSAERLDQKHLDRVLERAAEHGCQVLLAVVSKKKVSLKTTLKKRSKRTTWTTEARRLAIRNVLCAANEL